MSAKQPPPRKLLTMGLPQVGKTTFLAAFWHQVESKELDGALTLHKITGDVSYLNEIRQDWLACRKLKRTTFAAEQQVTMQLVSSSGGDPAEIVFPDLSGESFRSQWEDRRCTESFAKLASEATGFILMIHPSSAGHDINIGDLNRSVLCSEDADEADEAAQVSDKTGNSAAPTGETDEDLVSWSAARTKAQVQLVDLLQLVLTHQKTHAELRLAVIISAWDTRKAKLGKRWMDADSPRLWVDAEMPFLSQFLRANAEVFCTKYFGVSAQGGDIVADAAKLQSNLFHSKRPIVVGPDCEEHDLSAPIRWLLA